MDVAANIRDLVQEEIGPLGDEAWDWLIGVHFSGAELVWDVARPDVMAEEIVGTYEVAARMMRYGHASGLTPGAHDEDTRAARSRVRYPRPPEWWNKRSRDAMDGYRPLQQLVWSQLGIEGPVALAGAKSFLLDVRRLEREAGTRELLAYPDPSSMAGLLVRKEMQVRSGWTKPELKEAGLERDMFGERIQPLAHLSRYAAKLARRTGCSEEAACAFLLCDTPLRLPWVTYDYIGSGPPATLSPAIVLTIGTPDVPADDVRRAYLFARELLRTMRDQRGGADERRFRATTLELVGFVEERRPQMAWNAIHAEWMHTHPKGSKGYHSTMKSMRSSYYRAPMRHRRPKR